MKITPILSGIRSRPQRALCVLACLLPLCGFLHGQDSLVAFGRVASGGGLESSHSNVGGDIQITKGGVGIFEMEFNSPGAFAGATVDDFHVGLTVHDTSSNDDCATADVTSVNANTLMLTVYTADVEDSVSLSAPEPRDIRYFFQIYRIPAGAIVSPRSSGLLASGCVGANGVLLGSVAAHGTGVTSTRLGEGSYEITVAGPGLFAGDVLSDYSLALSVDGGSNDDNVIRGRASDESSDNAIVFNVFTDDAQSTSDDDNPDPGDDRFCFVIYRSGPLPPASALLSVLGRVDDAGTLLAGATAFPGGSIQSQRTDTGDYVMTVSAPGAFAGKDTDDYSLQTQIHNPAISDEFSNGRVVVLDANTIQVEVYTADVEQDIEFGTVRDSDFSFLVMETVEEVQTDLLIGKGSSLAAMNGNDVYSLAPGPQRLRVRAKKSGRARFYFGAENDGNLTRDIALSSVKRIKGVKPKFFLLTGGRSNVTGAIKSGNTVVPGIAPSAHALFEAKTKPKKAVKKKKSKIRIQGADVASGAAQDLVEARLKLR